MTFSPRSEAILVRVRKVAAVVFGCPEDAISYETSGADVDSWDSLSHTVFLFDLEREFSIRFDVSRIIRFANIGDLVREVERLTS